MTSLFTLKLLHAYYNINNLTTVIYPLRDTILWSSVREYKSVCSLERGMSACMHLAWPSRGIFQLAGVNRCIIERERCHQWLQTIPTGFDLSLQCRFDVCQQLCKVLAHSFNMHPHLWKSTALVHSILLCNLLCLV